MPPRRSSSWARILLDWLYTSETGVDYLMNKFGFLPVVDGMTSEKLDPISASVADAIASGNIIDWTFNTEWARQRDHERSGAPWLKSSSPPR